MTKLIVGLGNIGKEYEKTNHNMGFIVLDMIADEFNVGVKKNTCSSLIAEFNHAGQKVILAKPTTYMNNSGVAVKSLVKKFNIDIEKDLLIISDDFDLPLSTVRVKPKGSAGTHNGLKSVACELGTTIYPRLRVGVGKPLNKEDIINFVLSKANFGVDLDKGLEKGKKAGIMFIENKSIEEIMQNVN